MAGCEHIFVSEFASYDGTFESEFIKIDARFDVTYGSSETGELPRYTGDYRVVPKVWEQILPTASKVLMEDIVVTKVPYYETSNDSDGVTVFIASELDDMVIFGE